MRTKTFDDFIKVAEQLRDQAEKAETAFMLHLVAFEESKTWRDAGYNTFEQLLRDRHLGRPERFAEFVVATKVVSRNDIEEIGSRNAIVAGKLKGSSARRTFLTEAKKFVEEEGFPMGVDQAENVRQRLEPNPNYQPKRVRTDSVLSRKLAEAENTIKTLRARVKELEAQVKELKAAKKPQPRAN